MIPPETNLKTEKTIIFTGNDESEKILSAKKEIYVRVFEYIKKNNELEYIKLKKYFPEINIDTILNNLKKEGIIEFGIAETDNRIKIENKIFLTDKLEYDLLNSAQKKIAELVKEHNGEYNSNEIMKIIGCSQSPIKTMIKRGFLEIRQIEKKYELTELYSETENTDMSLNNEQKKVCNKILESIENDEYKTFLLYGITGSGKTEVYLRVIKEVIEKGGDCIMLVPEISLTPQTIARFRNRFGDKVSALHSMLSPNERIAQWNSILAGETKIVIGARSAVFAPFRNLKCIIVDEEHENSYKQSVTPNYNGRDVAIMRGFLEKCPVILGSATPTLESYYNALEGKYELLELSQRAVKHSNIPLVEICDIKKEPVIKDNFIFSRQLKESIENIVKRKEQAILFLNRRGFATLVICLGCGASFKCPECNISMTFHYETRSLVCHYCGYEISTLGKCPECKSDSLKFIGLGTEKIEVACRYFFPEAIIERIDADSVRKKNYLPEILQKFKNKDIDILVGTQILAKGLDFPNVTLVGIMLADITLNLPDFRSAERTFSLLTQVAGRAGRGTLKGKVVIQTYNPDHYAIKSSVNQDYQEFYNKEILIRKKFAYPPFTRLINIVFSGLVKNEVKFQAVKFAEYFNKHKLKNLIVLGPVPSPMEYIKKNYRFQVLIKGINLKPTKKIIKKFYDSNIRSKIKMSIDIDPQNLM
jgi:primosomal protein N' (replication factor Y)